MSPLTKTLFVALAAFCVAFTHARATTPPEPGERVIVVGNTFAERLAQSGYLEIALRLAQPNATLRQVPWSGDEAGLRPREVNVPGPEAWVAELQADTVIVCLGMSESFSGRDGLEQFTQSLESFVNDVQTAGEPTTARTVVLVSPIAHEDLGPPWVTGESIDARNRDIALYTGAMRDLAAQMDIAFVDLFHVEHPGAALTTNGIHPSEFGSALYADQIARALGWFPQTAGPASGPDDAADAGAAEMLAARLEAVRLIALDKHWLFRLRYRPTNTEYVWGRRHEPFGVVNFPPEMAQLDRMIDARDEVIADRVRQVVGEGEAAAAWEAVLGAARERAATDEAWLWTKSPSGYRPPEDEWKPVEVEARGTETSLGEVTIKPPDEFLKTFTVADGYEVNCFASEADFPELANPLAMMFDERGRLWVLCAGTYPHLLPGAQPACRLLVLEDTDADGRADTSVVFADGLMIPTGFAVAPTIGGRTEVYIGQAPDLLVYTDTDGDTRADRWEVVASGFGMPDSHHQLSAFEWAPDGALIMHEGIFSKANIETPWGTRRAVDAAVWRLDPSTRRLDLISHARFLNPWGLAFDDWGQAVLADASGGENFDLVRVLAPSVYPRKPARPGAMLHRGRPIAGNEIISGTHFPPEAQNSYLVNQSIGFHGTRWDALTWSGTGYAAERMPQDLLSSDDTNFRPVAMEQGPDGAVYIVDWCNPIIGHMQYSVRDPRRDSTHGRVWRVRHATRDLTRPADLRALDIAGLLEALRLPERNTRALARLRLQRLDTAAVLEGVRAMLAGLDPADPLADRLFTDALWVYHAHGGRDPSWAARSLAAGEPRARAAGVRVLGRWLGEGSVPASSVEPLLAQAASDKASIVRLEAVWAAAALPPAAGARVVTLAADEPLDEATTIAVNEVITYLGRTGEISSALSARVALERATTPELLAMPMTDASASVLLGRPDAPAEARRRALDHLTASSGEPAAQVLADRLGGEPRAAEQSAIAAVFGQLTPEELRAGRARLVGLLGDRRDIAAHAAAALLPLAEQADPALAERPRVLASALALLEPGEAPAWAVAAVQDAAGTGRAEPEIAVAQVVRHGADRAAVLRWLGACIDAGTAPLSAWAFEHELAVASLAALHTVDTAEWPLVYERYRVPEPAAEVLALGARVYHDEVIGCVRCHAEDGDGLEGFPPLRLSPWLAGDGRRSAGIVVHGLRGSISVGRGREYNSAMAPLGRVLDDEEIAAVLTYARRSFGNFAAPVTPGVVAEARSLWSGEPQPLDAAVLLSALPLSGDTILGVPPGAGVGDIVRSEGGAPGAMVPPGGPGAAAAGNAAAASAGGGGWGPGFSFALFLLLGGAVLIFGLAVVVLGSRW